jgi:hypothetical protein
MLKLLKRKMNIYILNKIFSGVMLLQDGWHLYKMNAVLHQQMHHSAAFSLCKSGKMDNFQFTKEHYIQWIGDLKWEVVKLSLNRPYIQIHH